MTVSTTDKETDDSLLRYDSRAGKTSTFLPQVSGTIQELCVSEGEKVRKGQTLFIIDQVPYKAALNTAVANVKSAKAALATAKLTYDSNKELFAQKVVSDYTLKTAENSYLTAEAGLAQAEAQEGKRPERPVVYSGEKPERRRGGDTAFPSWDTGQPQHDATADYRFRQLVDVRLLLYDGKSTPFPRSPIWEFGRSI